MLGQSTPFAADGERLGEHLYNDGGEDDFSLGGWAMWDPLWKLWWREEKIM